MSKLSDIHSAYDYYSGTASTVARNAAFAGIALVWVFNTQAEGTIKLPLELLLPAKSLIIALGLDLLHYVVSALIWGGYGRIIERYVSVSPDTEVEFPLYINWPAIGLFWGKLIAVLFGYWQLFVFANDAIKFG